MATKSSTRIASGNRARLIFVQRVTEGQGTSGEPTEVWDTLTPLRVWAHIESVDAPERFTEGVIMNQISARSWTKFTFAYREDMDPMALDVPKSRRVLYLNRVYDIAAANETFDAGRRKGIELLTLSKAG